MPILRRLNRERGLDRDRVRPTAPGNFITIVKGGTIYYLLFQSTPQYYKFYELYNSPYPRAFGYRDEPAPDPPLRIFGAVSNPQDLIPRDILAISDPKYIIQPNQPAAPLQPPITSTPFAPNPLPPNTSKVLDQPNKPGKMFSFTPGVSAIPIISGSLAIAEVLIKADEDNSDDIWLGYDQTVARGNGWRLISGAGLVLGIDDLSKVFLIAFNSTDSVQVIYNI